jgi:hypothetical protein
MAVTGIIVSKKLTSHSRALITLHAVVVKLTPPVIQAAQYDTQYL